MSRQSKRPKMSVVFVANVLIDDLANWAVTIQAFCQRDD